MQYVIAFVTGGMICALSQILMEKTKMLLSRLQEMQSEEYLKRPHMP